MIHKNGATGKGWEARRDAAVRLIEQEISNLDTRRDQLTAQLKFKASAESKKIIADNIKNYNDAIERCRKQLRVLWKGKRNTDLGSETSFKSSNISKITWTKPYRG